MLSRGAAALGAALLLGSLSAVPALAHDERSLHSLTVIDSVSRRVEGLEIRVVHMGAPALAVRNTSGRVLTVLDERGEPFLKIGPDGVSANVASATTYRSIDPASDDVPAGIRSDHGWAKFSNESEWSWFDPRLESSPKHSEWSVPMRVGNEPIVAAGSFESLHGHGHFLTDADVTAVAGLDLRLVEGPIPAVFVRNDTDLTLVVRGRDGEPFLEIGPRGVRANLMSPSYYAGGAQRIAPVPRWADPGAAPRWKLLSEQPVWGWLDYRAALPAEMQQRSVLGADERVVHSWSIDMQLGGRALPVSGTVKWVPPVATAATGSVPSVDLMFVALILVLLVAGVGTSTWVSRRRPSLT